MGLSVRVKRWDESVKKEMQTLVGDGVNSFVLDLSADDQLFQVRTDRRCSFHTSYSILDFLMFVLSTKFEAH